jgi:hypothetical protein
LLTSDLSAAEIKKLYRETIEKKKSTTEKNIGKKSDFQKTFPAEADAVPSESYKKIHASKMLKGKPAASGGTGSGQVLDSECGSFFNPGDNRISRTVYQEDHLSLSVTSLSFNPSNWECRQCPKTVLSPSLFYLIRTSLGSCRLSLENVSQSSGWNRGNWMSWETC